MKRDISYTILCLRKYKNDNTCAENSGDYIDYTICVKKVSLISRYVTQRFRYILSIFMDKLSIDFLHGF